MVFMALYAEARAAPSLPDPLVALVPFITAVARYNYLLWLAAYVPVALALLVKDGERFLRYMIQPACWRSFAAPASSRRAWAPSTAPTCTPA